MKHVTNKMRGAKMLRETFRYSVIADAVVSAVVAACRGKRSPNSIYTNSRSTALAAVMLIFKPKWVKIIVSVRSFFAKRSRKKSICCFAGALGCSRVLPDTFPVNFRIDLGWICDVLWKYEYNRILYNPTYYDIMRDWII